MNNGIISTKRVRPFKEQNYRNVPKGSNKKEQEKSTEFRVCVWHYDDNSTEIMNRGRRTKNGKKDEEYVIRFESGKNKTEPSFYIYRAGVGGTSIKHSRSLPILFSSNLNNGVVYGKRSKTKRESKLQGVEEADLSNIINESGFNLFVMYKAFVLGIANKFEGIVEPEELFDKRTIEKFRAEYEKLQSSEFGSSGLE